MTQEDPNKLFLWIQEFTFIVFNIFIDLSPLDEK